MRLQGKTALVTGATSGIGAAIAQAFAREGAQVVITGRNAERGQAVARRIREAGGTAHFVAADLTSRKDIDRLVSETRQAVGHLDILVNNAGIFPMAETAQIDETTIRRGHRDERQSSFLPDSCLCSSDGRATVRKNH